MKRSMAFLASICLSVSLGTGAAQAAPSPPLAGPSSSHPLPGCVSSGPNVGAVTSLKLAISQDSAVLTWSRPQTRSGWVISGYNIYRLNRASGIMELYAYTAQQTTSFPAQSFRSDDGGSIPVQVAAVASRKTSSGSASEEGCRSARVMGGPIQGTNAQLVSLTTWEDIQCRNLGNQMIFSVAGFYKANNQVVKPLAFGLVIALLPKTPTTYPRLIMKFAQFANAVRQWSGEALTPGAEFTVTAIRCFKP